MVPATPRRQQRSLLGRVVTHIGVAFVLVELVVLLVFTIFYRSSLIGDREDHILRYAAGVRPHVEAALEAGPKPATEEVDADLDAALRGKGSKTPASARRPFIPPNGAPVDVWVFGQGVARRFSRTGVLESAKDSGWVPERWPAQVKKLLAGELEEVPVDVTLRRIVRMEPLQAGKAGSSPSVLYLECSLRQLNRQVATYSLMAFGTGALALVFAAVVTMTFLRRALLLPLSRIIEADNAARRGDVKNAVVDAGDIPEDEVGAIMRSRNHLYLAMTRAQGDLDGKNVELEKQREELRIWGRELERLVQDKTAALLRAREILHRTEKLAALGRLAANVAHEINNPLASIAGYAEAAQLDLSEGADDEVASALRTIEEQAFRCKDILKRLLGLARTDELHPELLALGRLVRETAALSEPARKKRGVALRLELPDGDGPQVLSDAASLQQVILNLVENAVDAACAGEGEPWIQIRDDTRGADEIALRVTDSGRGIPQATQKRVFDPFYTTKAVGRGTGLGLAICQSLVERLGGRISLESYPGEGATFTIWLPREMATARQPRDATPAGGTPEGIIDASGLVEAQLRMATRAADPDSV